MENLTLFDFYKGIKDKKFTVSEVTSYYLNRIQNNDFSVKAFLEVFKESALEEANKIDEEINRGFDVSVLTGAPMAIKDNILLKGKKSSAASKILENHIASYDATVISKLKKEGVIFLGRTNMDEFAFGGSTEFSAFKVTSNPHDLDRVPGGTSGGSAAAVASNMALAALGTDTGGSVRQPASFCGIVGLRPTYGAVSRYGVIAAASSFDQVGTLTKTVTDAVVLFKSILGKSRFDSTSIKHNYDASFDKVLSLNDIKGKIFGIPKELWDKDNNKFLGVDNETSLAMKEARESLENLGARFVEISIPSIDYSLACYYILIFAEESSNLSRFDGLRYAESINKPHSLKELYRANRSLGFGPEVKRRIILGNFVLSSGFYEAYYGRASKVREVIRADVKKALSLVEVLFMPTAPTVAYKKGEKLNDPLALYYGDIFTVLASLTGNPALTVPVRKYIVGSKVLPVGFQVVGKHFDEATLFQIGRAYERLVG
ncbi:MAG: Asp-tRNA(Asn)/Glu-tRNA(Gln) amidotransferase GatCAB subunit A [Candidatus Liptonbacteria bacterium CG11_big_fil_rev_8_21_14_0_20_35_14]|uniref:Glutamyl-tRNA(Gln) amidotransferase subunit A n=1 Tax=Candidatus Liptonbacteria bacterium CG11_big_fil_rev_8_21_14_0_20_35_14 TaxID=1974634 RepID=A0A2H0N8E3_9BACT|nr:MAG: Asp-tRNA(Asn)/Glu-tRNA(Gln) amidotransferase GatCAB subunit A [Candidatus Liptonbacteria bacterium CG11_big_fil_rev_8_21_14_0_20_35_14]